MADTNKKRVRNFYRASTNKQLTKDDIPMQRISCMEFIEKHQDWIFDGEYVEKGVSGYKVYSSDRDDIQQAINDAKNGEYDILLCFMKDRLGRKEDDTPFVVEAFVSLGIEVWSVVEGQQKIENRIDKLMNYLYFWNAGGESEKTSIRVNEKHIQMTKAGEFRGGTAAFGYELIKSGKFSEKDKNQRKELYTRVKNEEEAKTVYLIYDLVDQFDWGGNRIAKHLNSPEINITTRTGGKWSASAVNYILRNPIYKGYEVYGKRSAKSGSQHNQPQEKWIYSNEPIAELIIVPEDKWDRVQVKRNDKNPNKNNTKKQNHPTKGKLLFVGFIKCGHCKSPLTTTYSYKTWTNKDGTTKQKLRSKYRCSGKALNKKECDGHTLYAQNKIEEPVIQIVKQYLRKLKSFDFTKDIEAYNYKNLKNDEKELNKLKKSYSELNNELKILNEEIIKCLMGKSNFSQEKLSSLIENKEQEISKIDISIKDIEDKLLTKQLEIKEMMGFQKVIPKWEDIFDAAPFEKKKVMLSQIIDYIEVYKDTIDVHVKIYIEQMVDMANWGIKNGEYNHTTGESELDKNTTNKIIEKSFEIAI